MYYSKSPLSQKNAHAPCEAVLTYLKKMFRTGASIYS